jgi:hypothetical protein
MLFRQLVLNRETLILASSNELSNDSKRGGCLGKEVNSIEIVDVVEVEKLILIQRKEVV